MLTTVMWYLPLLLLTIVWSWFRWNYRRIISTASKLSSKTSKSPRSGHFKLSLDRHNAIKLYKRIGGSQHKNRSFWVGPFPIFVIGLPVDIHTVLTSKKCQKRFHYDFMNPLFGNGLLTAPEDIHRITRPHFNSLFTPRNLEQAVPLFNASGHSLVRDLSTYVGRGQVDVMHPISFLNLINTCYFLLGPMDAVYEESEELRHFHDCLDGWLDMLTERTIKPWLWSDKLFYFLHKKEVDAYRQTWNGACSVLIEAAKKKQKEEDCIPREKNGDVLDMKSEPYSRLTFLESYNLLRQKHPEFTDQDMKDELFTLIVTGSHTTKTLIASMLLALAANPDIQERLYQEVVSVVGAEDTDITTDDLCRMPYLEQVFKETNRIFSIVPVLPRHCTEDVKLSNFTVPAGATVTACLTAQLYDPDVFPDPHTFDPDHFSPERSAKMKKYSFTPFSVGQRNCIGSAYAAMSIKIFVIHVIRRFRLSTSVNINDLKFVISVSSYSSNGYHMELYLREGAKT